MSQQAVQIAFRGRIHARAGDGRTLCGIQQDWGIIRPPNEIDCRRCLMALGRTSPLPTLLFDCEGDAGTKAAS